MKILVPKSPHSEFNINYINMNKNKGFCPNQPKIKLNLNEASSGNPRQAGIGGIFWDLIGILVGINAQNIGESTNNFAEVMDLMRDLYITKELKI